MSQLDAHNIIALDMDGCLVPERGRLNMDKILLLRRYVIDHPRKTYIIVTFRDDSSTADIPDELRHAGLPLSRISGIYNCPQHLWRSMGRIATGEDTPDLREDAERYLLWKGKTCHQHGATVLVDDRKEDVILGCLQYGVEFVDIVDFMYSGAAYGSASVSAP